MLESTLVEFDAFIFDIGGVILNIDYNLTMTAFSELAGFEVNYFYTQNRQVELFDRFECGIITASEFRDGLRDLLNLNCSDILIDRAWNRMLLDIPPPRIKLLENLAKLKPIFILSNTNTIHKKAFDEIFMSSFGDRYINFDGLFTRAYYSHQMGERKPNPSIFQKVIDEQKLTPNKTLFVEDTFRHIQGAQKVGLQIHHLEKGQELIELPFFKINKKPEG